MEWGAIPTFVVVSILGVPTFRNLSKSYGSFSNAPVGIFSIYDLSEFSDTPFGSLTSAGICIQCLLNINGAKVTIVFDCESNGGCYVRYSSLNWVKI